MRVIFIINSRPNTLNCRLTKTIKSDNNKLLTSNITHEIILISNDSDPVSTKHKMHNYFTLHWILNLNSEGGFNIHESAQYTILGFPEMTSYVDASRTF